MESNNSNQKTDLHPSVVLQVLSHVPGIFLTFIWNLTVAVFFFSFKFTSWCSSANAVLGNRKVTTKHNRSWLQTQLED